MDNALLSLIAALEKDLNKGCFKSDTLDENQRFSGISHANLAIFTFLLTLRYQQNYLLLLPQERNARRIFQELNCLQERLAPFLKETLGLERFVSFFPSLGILPYTYAVPDSEREGQRVKTLSHLILNPKKSVVVTSVEAISQKLVSKQQFQQATFQLKKGFSYDIQELTDFLVCFNYDRVSLVEVPGQFSVKGGIIDIFCPSFFDPIRLDFFGDEIESIRSFDPVSQQSLQSSNEVMIFPRRDMLLNQNQVENLSQKIRNDYPEIEDLPPCANVEHFKPDGLWDLFPLVSETSTLLEYYDQAPVVLAFDQKQILHKIENLKAERSLLYNKNSKKVRLDNQDLFLEYYDSLGIENQIELTTVPVAPSDTAVNFVDAPKFKGRFSSMVSALGDAEYKSKTVFISSTLEAQQERIEHILKAYPERKFKTIFFQSELREGFGFEGGLVLTDSELFGKTVRANHIKKTSTQIIESFVDLREGDYIVHLNYGIGRFVQLKRMSVAGHERDFLQLEYNGGDKLFVPLEKLNLVHRYIGSSENPRLDFLGKKSSWEATKKRVQEDVEKVANELLVLYARREKSRGIQYPTDSEFQEEFEAAFPFEETDHQILAITDVKRDMEDIKPMDRLICGDVGFGKTEIAIRAAFKAVMAGKQVAVLCPTTILALQHYNTFSSRFLNYPASIEFISRFKTTSQNNEVKKLIAYGKIDIVIGTHALLSETVKFKNLGLLIIDEEQRFGVVHKEAIKQLKANVDCLTLTATPIPRTLQMSLVGIRDLSLISTPPRGRQKIETSVLEENDEVLHQAIQTELNRAGQVYVLHNNTKTIEAQAERIGQLCPKARIAILHGKMSETEIENIMIDFYRHTYDVLITTTIIESGIDISNVNTLIVMNAQNFGLSQMYQIKGRVGRGSRQAYAIFFYRKDQSLTEIAMKRLNTLQEYSELGSGFKIAMKDLEIRGAGNILGKAQSGDIVDVGFELYVQLLQEKLSELRNEKRDDFESSIVISQDFYFPENYMSDTRQKMEFYKKLASSTTVQALQNVVQEMNDRFGKPPDIVSNMIAQEEIRIQANLMKLEKLELVGDKFTLTALPQTTLQIDKLSALIQNDQRFAVNPNDARKIHFTPMNKKQALIELKGILQYIQ